MLRCRPRFTTAGAERDFGPGCHQVAGAPPVGYLFAAFLGYNPFTNHDSASVLNALPAQQAATITSRAYFPALIDTAFHLGLVEVLIFSIIMCLIGARLRGCAAGSISTAKINPDISTHNFK